MNHYRGREGIYRYARWDMMDDWLRLGWIPVADLGHPHGQYSFMAFWCCDCKPVVPA